MLMVRFAMQGLLPPLVAVSFAWARKSEPTSHRQSGDICERSIVVFGELFQQMFCDSYPSKFLFFCNEIGYPSGTYPSHF